jgi:GH3 auxin-responsive promoter
VIIPYYNATEGTFGYQPHELWDGDDYHTLVLKYYCGVWYELVNDKGEIINVSEAELCVSYRLLISTYDGLCRYELGDVIEIVDVEQSWIKIVGRTSEYIDIANEHTQIQHIQQTMSQLGEHYNI